MLRIIFYIVMTTSAMAQKFEPDVLATQLAVATVADKRCGYTRQLQVVMNEMSDLSHRERDRVHNRFPDRFKHLEEVVRVMGDVNWCSIYNKSNKENIEKEKKLNKKYN